MSDRVRREVKQKHWDERLINYRKGLAERVLVSLLTLLSAAGTGG